MSNLNRGTIKSTLERMLASLSLRFLSDHCIRNLKSKEIRNATGEALDEDNGEEEDDDDEDDDQAE